MVFDHDGLVVVDPQQLRSNRVAPPVAITSVVVNGQRAGPNHGNLRLKSSQSNNLEIRYAGLSFVSPEKVAFRYMLSGYENAWIDSGERRAAFYTNLPPGSFTFRVQARNADGVWSETPASFAFTVEPKLYQRWWFFPALFLLGSLAVAAIFRMRIRRLRQRFDLILAERNRIARELHDTLLQGLSGITMQLQALSRRLPASGEKEVLGEIIRDAGRCATEARQSLWGLRQPKDDAPEFSRKLADIAQGAVDGKPLALSLHIAPISLRNMPDCEFQLLRIAQEAAANAIKHANASRLSVHAYLERSKLVLKVEDDGVGQGTMTASPGHYGIQGMRERAEEIGAELSIDSSPERGTSVWVTLPLAKSTFESNPESGGRHPIEVG
jgi:signal transduction histidine kinase